MAGVLSGEEARFAILSGMDRLADVVKITLGPTGKQVVLEMPRHQFAVTHDGAVISEHWVRKSGAAAGTQMVRNVATEMIRCVGDGATTAIVILQAIYHEGLKHITAGAVPCDVRKGISAATQIAVKAIESSARSASSRDLACVATSAANGDEEIGAAVAWALEEVGPEGPVTITSGEGSATQVELRHGTDLPWGYTSARCVTDRVRMRCVLSGVRVVVCDRAIESIDDLRVPLIAASQSGESLLVFAHEVSKAVLQTIGAPPIRRAVRTAVVAIPDVDDRTSVLQDIAALTESKVVPAACQITEDDMGVAAEAVVTGRRTSLTARAETPAREAVARRLLRLQMQLRTAAEEDDAESLRFRIATLAGRVAVIRAGAPTEAARNEKRIQIERALASARAAAWSGVVTGGGLALFRAAAALENLLASGDAALGVSSIRAGLEAPLAAIIANAGYAAPVMLNHLREAGPSTGFNVLTGSASDLGEAGILDAAALPVAALRVAASTASALLATDCLITAGYDSKLS